MPASTVLADKVSTFPAAMPEWAIADALNAVDPALPVRRSKVAVAEVRGLLLANGFWPRVVFGAEDVAATADLRGLCVTTRDTLVYLTQINADDPEVYAKTSAMIAGLLAFQLIDQATHDAIIALADTSQSWADLNNNGAVSARDVGLARGGNPGA